MIVNDNAKETILFQPKEGLPVNPSVRNISQKLQHIGTLGRRNNRARVGHTFNMSYKQATQTSQGVTYIFN